MDKLRAWPRFIRWGLISGGGGLDNHKNISRCFQHRTVTVLYWTHCSTRLFSWCFSRVESKRTEGCYGVLDCGLHRIINCCKFCIGYTNDVLARSNYVSQNPNQSHYSRLARVGGFLLSARPPQVGGGCLFY